MTYDDLYVLIPSHSLEDFPSELGDEESAGLLNAFAVLWHPHLLAEAGVIPSWHRSDEPPDLLENRLVIIPAASQECLPGGWAEHARKEGAVVIDGMHDRAEMLAAAVDPLQVENPVDPDLVADFLALGTCFLQLELLTTHMHHFSNMDEVHLQRDAIAAAEAAVSGDATAAREHLKACFDVLSESREQFYPVDCYLIDLCLLIPRLADDHLRKTLDDDTPLNILVSAEDLEKIAEDKPDLLERLRESWEAGTCDVIGGEWTDSPTPLLPLESVLWNFQRGQAVYRKLCGRVPKTWGRRRFGFSTNLPQILNKFGNIAGLHFALDDGLYPDAEQSKIRWEGCDGTIIDAMTRIPLAADGASSYLRFPQLLAESMEEDQVAGLIFARWPDVKAPWFEDFRRMHRYSPCLGRFVTLQEFFEQTDDPGRMSSFEAGEYLTPFLIQSVASEEANPISRYADHLKRRQRFDAACFFAAAADVLVGKPLNRGEIQQREDELEKAGPEAKSDTIETAEENLSCFEKESARRLATVIMNGSQNERGVLLLNSLAFPRTVSLELPTLETAPLVQDAVKGVQFDQHHKLVTATLPPCGFLWLPAVSPTPAEPTAKQRKAAKKEIPLIEENVLRNEFFEVWINAETGGIGRIKGYGRVPNRLSQQLAFRFSRERTWTKGEGEEAQEFKSYYSEMRCLSTRVLSEGPQLAEIETTGEIIDQTNGERLAGFQQRFRVYRGRKIVEVDIELDVKTMPDGDPWTNYFAARFAWNDSTASLTRTVHQGAHGFRGERFESLHYFEIATPEERTTILTQGQTFHRKTGPRMLDTLLLAAGETRRSFRFVIAVDAEYPMQAALDAMVPPAIVPTETGPPTFGHSGWFFHVDASNVQLLRLMPP
ncbi:MAG: hypothetical protein IID45_10095, partial [Planctomycetes bacterium]|nr:hypothetical protein [Planctomycetota bacterium]